MQSSNKKIKIFDFGYPFKILGRPMPDGKGYWLYFEVFKLGESEYIAVVSQSSSRKKGWGYLTSKYSDTKSIYTIKDGFNTLEDAIKDFIKNYIIYSL